LSSAEGDCGGDEGLAGALALGTTEAGLDGEAATDGLPVPFVPHATRNALNPARADPWRKRRRLRSMVAGRDSLSVIGLLAGVLGAGARQASA
jgi:hypothetical protein